jgi:hypothetical protein
MLGCVAAVTAIVSPSHPRPAVIQRTSISEIGSEARALPSRIVVVSATRSAPRNWKRESGNNPGKRGSATRRAPLQLRILQNSRSRDRSITRRYSSQAAIPRYRMESYRPVNRTALFDSYYARNLEVMVLGMKITPKDHVHGRAKIDSRGANGDLPGSVAAG